MISPTQSPRNPPPPKTMSQIKSEEQPASPRKIVPLKKIRLSPDGEHAVKKQKMEWETVQPTDKMKTEMNENDINRPSSAPASDPVSPLCKMPKKRIKTGEETAQDEVPEFQPNHNTKVLHWIQDPKNQHIPTPVLPKHEGSSSPSTLSLGEYREVPVEREEGRLPSVGPKLDQEWISEKSTEILEKQERPQKPHRSEKTTDKAASITKLHFSEKALACRSPPGTRTFSVATSPAQLLSTTCSATRADLITSEQTFVIDGKAFWVKLVRRPSRDTYTSEKPNHSNTNAMWKKSFIKLQERLGKKMSRWMEEMVAKLKRSELALDYEGDGTPKYTCGCGYPCYQVREKYGITTPPLTSSEDWIPLASSEPGLSDSPLPSSDSSSSGSAGSILDYVSDNEESDSEESFVTGSEEESEGSDCDDESLVDEEMSESVVSELESLLEAGDLDVIDGIAWMNDSSGSMYPDSMIMSSGEESG
ncbi:hypothetical protein HYALB_00005444 [Hymenoscyphus albidus]|uniref:Uncharacterized protein n=1 Tax=Hymenoscyphus albidus TaxID=595503 RepID=A0A9N9PQP5_9HELO|nr:hypothetical protein HYALB_00005444 [Hymenoscyphus albidus]